MAGALGVAVFDVVQNVGYCFGYLYGAVSQAAQPIMSTYQSEYNLDGCRALERLGNGVGLSIGIVATAVVSMSATWICRVFGLVEPDDIELCAWAIRVYCAGTLFGGTNEMLGGYYQAREDRSVTFLIATLRGAVLLISLTLLFARLGVHEFWFLYPATEIMTLAVLMAWLRLHRRKGPDITVDRVYRAILRDRVEDIGTVVAEIRDFCACWHASSGQEYFVQMTVEELCAAIIEKGFGAGGDRDGVIEITLVAGKDGLFTLHVRDSAVAFNPFAMEDITLDNSADAGVDFNALGMGVIKQKAREFYYRRYQGFNTMVVRI